MLIELREYELDVDEEAGSAVYRLVGATIHPTKRSANQWVADLVSENGMGQTTLTVSGPLPGRLWAVSEVAEIETSIRTGTDLARGGSPPVPPEADGPLPPDDEEGEQTP